MVKIGLLGSLILLLSFNKKKNNVLRLLLTLECLVLIMFNLICFTNELFFSIVFLSVGACEAAVGLGCLVGLIRFGGQNFINFVE